MYINDASSLFSALDESNIRVLLLVKGNKSQKALVIILRNQLTQFFSHTMDNGQVKKEILLIEKTSHKEID